jgi:hypothetical protein
MDLARTLFFGSAPGHRKILMRRLIPGIILLFVGATHVPTSYYGLTYTTETPDEQFRLVMLSPWPVLEDAVSPVEAASGRIPYSQIERTKELRAKYPRSGLYRNDGSSTPLWTVDWYSDSIALSSDGIHLCSLAGDVQDLSSEALVFYENGEEIRRHTVGDLVRSMKDLSWSFGSYSWKKGFAFNADNNTLAVTLLNKDRFSFDIRSGDIIRVERDPRKLYLGFLVGIALLVLIVGGWIVVRRF